MTEKQKQELIYINSQVIQDNQDEFQELVYQFALNKEFQTALIPLWKLFSINFSGEIQKSELKKYLVNVFQFLIYTLRKGDLECLAEEECQRLLNNDQNSISLDVFTEIFAYLTAKWVENSTIAAAISFINHIFERTTRLIIRDTLKKDQDIEIRHDISVQLFSRDTVESNFNVLQKDLLYSQTIYYEEVVARDEQAIKAAENDPTKTIQREFLGFKEIVPLGFTSESYLNYLINNDYKFQNQPPKIPIDCAAHKFPTLQKVSIVPIAQESVVQNLQDYSQNEKPIQIIAILNKNPCGQSAGNFVNYNRINIAIARPIYFQTIKVKGREEEKQVNILSDFLDENDYNIDQIERLNRKRVEKLDRKKTAQETGEDVKKMLKKTPTDYDELKKRINFELLKNVLAFQNKPQLIAQIKSIKQTNMEQDASGNSNELKFKSYTSKYNYLPKDTMKPFCEDVIEYANRDPLQILVIGKPKIGKTTFCREFAKSVDIVHIEPLLLVEKSLNRIKEFEENPPEVDDDGNPKEVLPDCDKKVKDSLENGREIPSETLVDLVNNELKQNLPSNKGFILDLPLNNRSYEFSWVDAIVRNKVNLPKIGCRYFSHIIEFQNSDQEVIQFMTSVMENPETNKVYSQYDRDALIKPKKIPVEGEEEEEEEPPADDEDEDAKKPQDEKDLAFIPNNELETVQELLKIYNNKTIRRMSEFYSHLSQNKHLKIAPSGLSPVELVSIAVQKLGEEVEVLRPLAIKLEGGSEKDQLTIEGQKIYRQWSQWQQIDPVELMQKGKVTQGRGDLACDYGGRVFLFENEENHQKFFENPRKYLQTPPQLPRTYNVAIVGPRCAGKRTYSKKLAAQYGWNLIDIQDIICQTLEKQKQIENEQGHQPSNFEPRANDIHLSEAEWKEFYKGKELSTKDVWPVILHKLGCQLQKKPEGWGVEKKEDEDEDEAAKKEEEEAKKKLQKKAAKKPTKESKKEGDDDKQKVEPVEDLPLKEIIQQIQEDGKTIKPVQGIMIVGQPMTEEHINILKYHNIPIDKIVALVDTSEEEPGKVLNSRPGFEENYNLENELAQMGTVVGLLKETYGEENIKEVHIGGTEDEVYNRIRGQIDPFFVRADDEGMIRVQGDVQEDEDNIVFGEYGPFCPVTLKEDGWLLPGKFENPDKGESIEAYVQGRRHLFYSEGEQTKFKENVSAYFKEGEKVRVPPPRIMFMGVRGAGLHSQLKKLQEKYKIPVMDFKANLQGHLQNEKIKRRSDRLYDIVGFKPDEIQEDQDDDGNVIQKVIPNPEVEEEHPEFDKKAHEIELTKRIFQGVNQVFLNGNFIKPVPPEDETLIDPNDETQMPIEAELNELLHESKKLPEAIFYLQVSDEQFIARKYDTIKQGLIDDYNAKIARGREEKRIKKEEEAARRQKLIDEGEEVDPAEAEEEEEPEDEAAIQEGLNELLNAKKEELMAQKNSDQESMDALTAEFDNIGIPIIPIPCNRSIEKVQDQIQYKLSNYLEKRQNLFEKYQAFEIKRPVQEEDDDGNLPVDPLQYYEKSYNYRKSRYHDRNALSLIDVPRNIEYPLIYRNRIYYFASREEQQAVKQQPLKFLNQKTFPNDIKNRPVIFLVGKQKSGKSTLAKILEENLQVVRIKPSQILEEFIETHKYTLSLQAIEYQRNGQEVTDEMMVDLIIKRVQLADCVQNGWVLDGFPKTRRQAELFTLKGLTPSNVFSIRLDNFEIKQRARLAQNAQRNKKFGYNDIILHTKLQNDENNILQIESYYLSKFNNIRFLNSKLSKWGLFDQAKKAIHASVSQRQNFARSLITDQPVQINNMCFTPNEILYNLGSFKNYSPVSLKTNRKFVKNGLKNSNLVYFDRFIYILASLQETQDFLERPDLYLYQKLKKMDVSENTSLGQIVSVASSIECKQHCMGNLLNNKLEKSMLDISCNFQGKVYSFSSFKERNSFNAEPQSYMNVKLPDKLPVNFSKKNLVKKVAKEADCTAYLEHHLGHIVMRVLAQLGYKRLKYPTINCKETALKFIGVSLKALNPNKDESYRQKYSEKLHLFLKHCQYSETITNESNRKSISWKQSEEQQFQQLLSSEEERCELLESVGSTDVWNQNDEDKYQQINKQYQDLCRIKDQDQSSFNESEQEKLNDVIFEYKMYSANKQKRGCHWQPWDEENLLKITEEFAQFREVISTEDKDIFFKKFIR